MTRAHRIAIAFLHASCLAVAAAGGLLAGGCQGGESTAAPAPGDTNPAVEKREARTEPDRAPGSPFRYRLTLRKTAIDPSHGPDFELRLQNATADAVLCDLQAALSGLRFAFSPVGEGGSTTVCPGPFVASPEELARKRPLSKLEPQGGHCWNSRLNFPRDLLPGNGMNRDYPTPPPGVYDLTAVMDFPACTEGWSGRIVTPPVRVTVLLSTKAKGATVPEAREAGYAWGPARSGVRVGFLVKRLPAAENLFSFVAAAENLTEESVKIAFGDCGSGPSSPVYPVTDGLGKERGCIIPPRAQGMPDPHNPQPAFPMTLPPGKVTVLYTATFVPPLAPGEHTVRARVPLAIPSCPKFEDEAARRAVAEAVKATSKWTPLESGTVKVRVSGEGDPKSNR